MNARKENFRPSLAWRKAILWDDNPWCDEDLPDIWEHLLSGSDEIGEFLRMDRPSNLDSIIQIRRWVKRHLSSEDGSLPQPTLHLLYYLCIAKATIFEEQALSTMGKNEQVEAVCWALTLPWLDELSRKILEKWKISLMGTDF